MKAAEASVRAMASRISLLQRCARNRTMRPETTRRIPIAHKHTGGTPLARVPLAARQKGTEFCAPRHRPRATHGTRLVATIPKVVGRGRPRYSPRMTQPSTSTRYAAHMA